MKKSAFYVCAVFSKAKKRLSHDVSYLSETWVIIEVRRKGELL
jgi:hypothetical protein